MLAVAFRACAKLAQALPIGDLILPRLRAVAFSAGGSLDDRRPNGDAPAMALTDYHAKYIAFELTKRHASDDADKLASAVAGAQVDLNPHQVDAALFAFQSPLSRGALLADEVGLGKTIEAGLVIAQKWAERRRCILVITPANLRKQWYQELTEKFFLPCKILESKSYNQALKAREMAPFDDIGSVIICSYQFARGKAADVTQTRWDLVVIDEAHRLRNVYKPSNIIANTLKLALKDRNKLLLTATPLQNSLLELYGLISFIDEQAFGDLKSFREQFANLSQDQTFRTLKERLRPLCHRTLRRQVTAYIPYTKRHAILEPFEPGAQEDQLYGLVTDYLQRENLHALPRGQRTLITLVLRKLLASSTFAIGGALMSMANRLRAKLEPKSASTSLDDELAEDYEGFDETAEEWVDDDEPDAISGDDRAALAREIADLDAFSALAHSIHSNAKGAALLKALKIAFAKADELGAAQKAIVFTESCRTQNYLLQLLEASPFAEGIVLFNGTNADVRSKKIYAEWSARHKGSDRVTGSKSADMRSALVDYFREDGRILIATEAGAEGINLQFCSLVVNYDLPWNPQRIEQRIGRCHRYGQKHDVVVVNFVNPQNAADVRVFQLLATKLQLFDGVFGSSDEVLGAIESGVDFEKRIADIYQRCRRPEEIATAFDILQQELSAQIDESMTQTRRKLLENFDDEVREKLKVRDEASKQALSSFEQRLMAITQYELGENAEFIDNASFRLLQTPAWLIEKAPLGLYELPRRTGDAHTYRLHHPLAEAVLNLAKNRQLADAEIHFDYSGYQGKVTILQPLQGKSGILSLTQLSVVALDQQEDHLIFSAITDEGIVFEQTAAQRMFTLGGTVRQTNQVIDRSHLAALTAARQKAIQRQVTERNARFFEAEAAKLEGWADDLKLGKERDIKEIDKLIRETKRASVLAPTLEEKLVLQRQIKALELQRNQQRRALFDAQDEVDRRREELIGMLEGKLEQETAVVEVFCVRWVLE